MAEALTLADLLKGKPLELIQVTYIALGLLRALERLHATGQARGRLLPTDVLLTDPVSLATPPAPPDPAYETPETLRGQPITPQTDLYAFGLLLYEMLTRRPPFVAPDGEALRQQQLTWPLPDPRKFRPELDLELTILLLSLLDKDPAFRPPSAAEVRRRLTAIWRVGVARTPPQPDDLIGQLVSRCRVESLIGEGRLAWVFLARDVFDGQPVAVKVFKPAVVQDPAPLARFRDVAPKLFELSDPHIASPLGAGEIGGLWYLLVRYAPGRPLQALIRETTAKGATFSRHQVLDFVGQTAQALTAAHERGVVHGDLTPRNILISDVGQVMLTDFALAAVQPVESTPKALAGVTQVQGTPAYLAPEQIRSHDAPPAPPTDVYALGAVAYELLTGQPPFTGETDADVLVQHLEDKPPSIRSRRPEMPADVDTAFRHALAKAPEERFKTPLAFAQALEKAWYIPPPPPPPPPPKPPLAERLRANPALRRRLTLGAGAVALLLGVAGLLTGLGLAWNAGLLALPAAPPTPSVMARTPTLSATPGLTGTVATPTVIPSPPPTATPAAPVVRIYRAKVGEIQSIAGCFIRGHVFNAAGQGEAGVEVELYNANKQWMNNVITVAGGGYEFIAGGGGGFYLKLKNRRSEWSPLVNLKFGQQVIVDWYAR